MALDVQELINELTPQDLSYEEELKRNPYNLKLWLQYLEHKYEANPKLRFLIYERALSALPGSYKLWYTYLNERVLECKELCVADPLVEETNNVFERSLTYMHKMPRIWMMYGEFLTWQRFTTRTRKMFDRCLMALPVTQHDRIWPLYLKFVRLLKVPETAARVYRRYVQLNPDSVEEFVEYLKRIGRLDEAAKRLADVINSDNFRSKKGKTKMQMWHELCDIMTNHPEQMKSLNVDAIIRSGIRRYPQEIGKLWCSLANYYIRLGQLERARDIYEEAINSLTTVRDFKIVFDSYAQFEETTIATKMEAAEAEKQPSHEFDSKEEQDLFDIFEGDDIDLRLDRLESLMHRRPLLLSSVLLRQNPHNVEEWLKRVKIFEKREPADLQGAIKTFTQAVATINPEKVTGRFYRVWVAFAKFYEEYGQDLSDSRTIFRKATSVKFKGVDDLASVYCEWAEMELRHKNYKKARDVLREPCKVPDPELLHATAVDRTKWTVQKRVWRSTKMWSFYVDLESSLAAAGESTLEKVKHVYNNIITLKIATPQIILNFADFLSKNNYFEESFKVYEKGVALFDSSKKHCFPIWKTYLHKFLRRYKGTKLERARELFTQALTSIKGAESKDIFLLYARMEEKFGLARHAMRVYDKAVDELPFEARPELYNIYINRAADLFGVTRTREIYEKAIKSLPDNHLPAMVVRYAKLETRLGEVDRGRAIWQYGAQFSGDCNKYRSYWTAWEEFEVEHGNEETYKEMLRIKRSVAIQSTTIDFVKSGAMGGTMAGKENDSGAGNVPANPMEALEKRMPNVQDPNEIDIAIDEEPEAPISNGAPKPKELTGPSPSTDDPNEIMFDDDDFEIEQRDVPAEVTMGAMERFKKARGVS